MSDELNEELDSQPVEESKPTEIENTADSEAENPEVLRQKIAELESKNRQLYERAKKAETKPQENLTTNDSSPVTKEDFIRLDLKTEGYSSDEVDYLMRNGGRSALQDKYVIAAIEATRKAAKSKDATPSGTGKSPVYQKFGEQDLRNMSAEELEKIIPKG